MRMILILGPAPLLLYSLGLLLERELKMEDEPGLPLGVWEKFIDTDSQHATLLKAKIKLMIYQQKWNEELYRPLNLGLDPSTIY